MELKTHPETVKGDTGRDATLNKDWQDMVIARTQQLLST